MFHLNFLDKFQTIKQAHIKLRFSPAGQALVQLGDKLIRKNKSRTIMAHINKVI